MAKRTIQRKVPLEDVLATVDECELKFVAGTEQVKIGYKAALNRVKDELRRRFAREWSVR